ncbi:Proteinase inhibitor I25, cystatin domain-containing protein [Strongyloides ratti]|uniref:Proteinase inhibitor I25, cystatin domain-containing protein n=1 Tax=Strongyloides ratti TaxID=34506 RepID=A0A090KVQ2_STRRB|nr:Proteinase inhibitor I25, cystatin domain-containing protein [Strongyloides ratti]CEF59322.1 Proteinase inhibitor I25, cystatin domain-containing protein [Strongyloides ratti]
MKYFFLIKIGVTHSYLSTDTKLPNLSMIKDTYGFVTAFATIPIPTDPVKIELPTWGDITEYYSSMIQIGRYIELNVKSKEAKDAAKEALKLYNKNKDINLGNKVNLLKIIKIERQILCGKNYKFILFVKLRKCKNSKKQICKKKLELTFYKPLYYTKILYSKLE